MRKALAVLIAALSLSACDALAQTETVTGQVIDLYCYTQNKTDVGMDHRSGRECAWACVKYEGQPVGLLTAEGKVYQLAGGIVANNNAKIAPHLTHTVTAIGNITELDGMPIISTNDVQMVKQ